MLIRGQSVFVHEVLGPLVLVVALLGGLWAAAALDTWDAQREQEHLTRWQEHLQRYECETTVADAVVRGWRCNDGVYFATSGQAPARFGTYNFAE